MLSNCPDGRKNVDRRDLNQKSSESRHLHVDPSQDRFHYYRDDEKLPEQSSRTLTCHCQGRSAAVQGAYLREYSTGSRPRIGHVGHASMVNLLLFHTPQDGAKSENLSTLLKITLSNAPSFQDGALFI